jgi:hypothetical protein
MMTISARPTFLSVIKLRELGSVQMNLHSALLAHPAIPAMENAKRFPSYAQLRSRRAIMVISVLRTLHPAIKLQEFGSVQMYPNSALPAQPAIPAMENAKMVPPSIQRSRALILPQAVIFTMKYAGLMTSWCHVLQLFPTMEGFMSRMQDGSSSEASTLADLFVCWCLNRILV